MLRLIVQLSTLLFLYFLCRLFFVVFNHNNFIVTAVFPLFWHGARFDLSAIFMINALYIVLALLPFPFVKNKLYQYILKFLFIISNSFFLLLNCIDMVYFPFIQKRMQFADAFLFVNGEKGDDLLRLIPGFIAKYWYLWLGYILVCIFLYRLYNYSLKFKDVIIPGIKHYALATLALIMGVGISVLAIRGGLQMQPINTIHAAEVTNAQHIPVVLNTSFTIIKTVNRPGLKEVHYFADSTLTAVEKGIHAAHNSKPFNGQNIVVIIVESLSKEYLSFFNGQSKTPFLDSLFKESLVFTNAYANGKESIQGIPAVLASLPACQNDPFIFSPYSGNDITSFASLLKPMGYNASFFHGGSTGTMGFNSFCKLASIDHYYGREDYNNEKDFDGAWGIWDEPFLRYTAEKLKHTPSPFFASVFTLNTHDPFHVPEQYHQRFKQEGHPILSCVRYADYALKCFFDTIKNQPWFNNTLFIITADHTGLLTRQNEPVLNKYRIPIVFYKPDGSLKGINNKVINQIDILPTAMHLLNYPYPFFSLGRDVFENDHSNFSIHYNAGIYEYVDSFYCYQFNGEKGIGLYEWNKDSSFTNNLLLQNSNTELLDDKVKKFIQLFNNSLIKNKLRLGL